LSGLVPAHRLKEWCRLLELSRPERGTMVGTQSRRM
jgi:hypothetical protein